MRLFHENEIDCCYKKAECEDMVPFDCEAVKSPETE